MEIIPVKYGESVLPESMIFQNGAKDKLYPITFIIYLIKSGSRLILVDAGCKTMPGFEMKNFCGSVKALENMGISADSITDVVITHSHHDHIECTEYFKNAVIHIQCDEYEAGKKYIPDGFKVNLFDESLAVCEGVEAVKIGGHSKGSCVVEVTDGDNIYVIAGDECYLSKCLEEKIPTGVSYCLGKSEEFIKKYSDSKYKVFLCHDVI